MDDNNYIFHSSCQVVNLADIYKKYFGFKPDGFFIDIGAYDGLTHSNTIGLSLAGWGGICYEPVPQFYQICAMNHQKNNNVKVINKAIGNRNGTIEFYVAGPLSTYSDYYKNTNYWKNDYQAAYPITVEITRLDDSLYENNVPTGFDVMSLDVEGSETDVLMYFNINHWKPKMAIVEAQEQHPAVELRNQAPFINKYFYDAGYDKIYSDEINNIYVRDEKKAKEAVKKKAKEEEKEIKKMKERREKIPLLEVNDSIIASESSVGE